MDPNPKNAQAQVAERINSATNILVTVSANPSVDQLAAAIGLTLLLNKLGKHVTAVFSGQPPSTLEFLQPEKTLEKNTDSLRDFIISLDKAKADKLRYKVEEKVVKIFITPYRTSLSGADLEFSQGDFNVEVVIALGVLNRDDLDQAITAQGRILHDATIISINTAPAGSLGTLELQNEAASSLCEMLVSLGQILKPDFLDAQMATAFLTGIVAETERFSNDKTTPATMTIAGQLMTTGANQQLIATQLETPDVEPEKNDQDNQEPPSSQPKPPTPSQPFDTPTTNAPDETALPELPPPPPVPPNDDGALQISHEREAKIDEALDGLNFEMGEPAESQNQAPKDTTSDTDFDHMPAIKSQTMPELGDAPPDNADNHPSYGGALNAHAQTGQLDPSTDLLNLPPLSDEPPPILSHGTPLSQTPPTVLPEESQPQPKPVADSIEELEKNSVSPKLPELEPLDRLPEPPSSEPQSTDMDGAHNAVIEAMNAPDNSAIQTPAPPSTPADLDPATLASLRPPMDEPIPPASPKLFEDSYSPAPPNVADSQVQTLVNPPPAVPPPLMPPLPLSSNDPLASTSNPFTLPPIK